VTIRRALAGFPGVLVGLWPAGLLVGGLDLYRLPVEIAAGFALGALAGRASRLAWLAGLAAGAVAGLALHLAVAGAEWRFIAFAWRLALPLILAALAGLAARLALEHLARAGTSFPGQ
jgi:hypothetical protein